LTKEKKKKILQPGGKPPPGDKHIRGNDPSNKKTEIAKRVGKEKSPHLSQKTKTPFKVLGTVETKKPPRNSRQDKGSRKIPPAKKKCDSNPR